MEYPSNRVNWSSIFSCALIGSGIALVLSILVRAIKMATVPVNATLTVRDVVPLPFGWPDAIGAVLVMSLAFGAAGFFTSVLARFPTRIEGVLHALSGFMLAAITIHFMARGALFAGRPGYPWDLAVQPEFNVGRNFEFSTFIAWTTTVSVLSGLAACCGGASAGFNWLVSGGFRRRATRKDETRRAA